MKKKKGKVTTKKEREKKKKNYTMRKTKASPNVTEKRCFHCDDAFFCFRFDDVFLDFFFFFFVSRLESDESLLEETWRFFRLFFLRLLPPPDSDELLSDSEVLLELLLLVLLDQERFRFLIFSDFSLSLSAWEKKIEWKFIQNILKTESMRRPTNEIKKIPICFSSFLLDFVLSPWRTSLEGFTSSFFSLSSLFFFSSFSFRLCFFSLSFSFVRLRLSLSRLSSLRSFCKNKKGANTEHAVEIFQ